VTYRLIDAACCHCGKNESKPLNLAAHGHYATVNSVYSYEKSGILFLLSLSHTISRRVFKVLLSCILSSLVY